MLQKLKLQNYCITKIKIKKKMHKDFYHFDLTKCIFPLNLQTRFKKKKKSNKLIAAWFRPK